MRFWSGLGYRLHRGHSGIFRVRATSSTIAAVLGGLSMIISGVLVIHLFFESFHH